MKMLQKRGTPRGSMAQWVLFGAVAAVVGLVALVLAALGLVVGVLLAGIFFVATTLALRRRRGGVSSYAAPAQRPAGERKAQGDCVDLGSDAYTVRIVVDEDGQKS
jgi:hypothetical protein